MPAQLFRPVWQESAHLPPEQASPALQVVPHVPQLTLSWLTLTHSPLQFVSPLWQESEHLPPEQT